MNNKKSTKRALLSSVLSLVLCMAMLIGTTFAWFTDSATSGKNQIIAGNLDMSVEYSLDGETWNNLEGATDLFQTDLWEPGHTEVVALRIENLGSLAFKYNVNMNIVGEVAGTNVYDETFQLSDILTVSTYAMDGGAIGDALIGGLFNSEDGYGYDNTVPFKSASVLANDMPVPVGETGSYLVIKVDMPETVGNEANYKTGTQAPSIDFGINVLATQYVSERDTFGPEYDKDATYPVASAEELATALANGGNVVLAKDITDVDANTTITVAAGKDVTLDLNGHKLSATADKTGNQELFLVKGTMTVKNGSLELVAQNNQAWNYMATIFDVTAGGVLKVDGVTANVAGTDMNFFVHLNNWGSATLEMTNCDITTTYVAVRAFNSGNDMNTITIKDTDFHNGRMFWVHNYTSEGKDDSTLTLDIYGNNNTSDNAKPVRFGFSNSVYYDINGNLIP